jgi:hypothetical protein
VTRKLSPPVHPRRRGWSRHFRWEGPYPAGRTAIGREAIEWLEINDPVRAELREDQAAEGRFPPE